MEYSVGNGPDASASFAAYFVNPMLLWLAGLAIVPIILHFLLRHKPKKLLFPALRLIQLRKKNNVRRLRLKHLWLLLLRILVIVLIVLALARPTLPAANYSPNGFELLTILAIVLVGIGAYYFILYRWRQRRVANHDLRHRRTLLRAGTGVGMLLLFLLLFVWPYTKRVFAEIDAPPPDAAKNLPAAAVFLFDDTLSMGYQFENSTRLQKAAVIATQHLQNFKRGSKVAVATSSGGDQILFQADLANVRKRINPPEDEEGSGKLDVNVLSTGKLDRLLLAAVRRQVADRKITMNRTETDTFLREIYVFTDLSASSWDPAEFTETREALARHKWLQVYVIDVGVKEPTNVAITGVDLSRPAVVQGEELYVQVKMKAVGTERVSRVLKLNFFDEGGQKRTRDKVTIQFEPGLEVTHKFALKNFQRPFQQAEARLESTAAADPLAADDFRVFTVSVHPQPKVLIVSDSAIEAFLLRQALSPRRLQANERWFHSTYLPTTKLAETDLSKYDVVYLVNVGKPTKSIWESLEKYAQAGGGVGIALGINSEKLSFEAYESEAALRILPAKLLGQLEFTPKQFLDVIEREHPIFATFVKLGFGELISADIYKYWRVDEGPTKGKVIARYTDQRRAPAIITRDVGRGRTLLITTAIHQADDWNFLSRTRWRFVELRHAMTRYLTGRAAHGANFQPGDAVRVYWDRALGSSPRILSKPQTQVRLDDVKAPAGEANSIALTGGRLNERGNYRIYGGADGTRLMTGFSYNADPAQSDLTRLTTEQLDQIFGEKRYQVVRDLASLRRAVGLSRAGVEVFPLVVIILILIFCGEHFVANRFYQSEQTAEHQAAWG